MASLNLNIGAAIERSKRLRVEFEGHGHYRSRGFTMLFICRFSVARNFNDPGIWKDVSIKSNRLFGLIIKPQTRGDLLKLHGNSPKRF